VNDEIGGEMWQISLLLGDVFRRGSLQKLMGAVKFIPVRWPSLLGMPFTIGLGLSGSFA